MSKVALYAFLLVALLIVLVLSTGIGYFALVHGTDIYPFNLIPAAFCLAADALILAMLCLIVPDLREAWDNYQYDRCLAGKRSQPSREKKTESTVPPTPRPQ